MLAGIRTTQTPLTPGCAPHRALAQGCAPIETVVTLLEERRPLMFKLFKPIRDVGPEEVLAELRAVLDGRAAAEHQAFGGGGGGAGGGDERTSEPPVAH